MSENISTFIKDCNNLSYLIGVAGDPASLAIAKPIFNPLCMRKRVTVVGLSVGVSDCLSVRLHVTALGA